MSSSKVQTAGIIGLAALALAGLAFLLKKILTKEAKIAETNQRTDAILTHLEQGVEQRIAVVEEMRATVAEMSESLDVKVAAEHKELNGKLDAIEAAPPAPTPEAAPVEAEPVHEATVHQIPTKH